ncbi:hypothetical protein L596_005433 [Steinernema carpocapsae]|uniref:Uncharacterized protein n=1 Tax=Steinernema carpocapsae TaxID=34508 RepID=A0A4U8V0K8_STECR|nr:hypothetical protein L596_005433 [Steinernema carpocapsae]
MARGQVMAGLLVLCFLFLTFAQAENQELEAVLSPRTVYGNSYVVKDASTFEDCESWAKATQKTGGTPFFRFSKDSGEDTCKIFVDVLSTDEIPPDDIYFLSKDPSKLPHEFIRAADAHCSSKCDKDFIPFKDRCYDLRVFAPPKNIRDKDAMYRAMYKTCAKADLVGNSKPLCINSRGEMRLLADEFRKRNFEEEGFLTGLEYRLFQGYACRGYFAEKFGNQTERHPRNSYVGINGTNGDLMHVDDKVPLLTNVVACSYATCRAAGPTLLKIKMTWSEAADCDLKRNNSQLSFRLLRKENGRVVSISQDMMLAYQYGLMGNSRTMYYELPDEMCQRFTSVCERFDEIALTPMGFLAVYPTSIDITLQGKEDHPRRFVFKPPTTECRSEEGVKHWVYERDFGYMFRPNNHFLYGPNGVISQMSTSHLYSYIKNRLENIKQPQGFKDFR